MSTAQIPQLKSVSFYYFAFTSFLFKLCFILFRQNVTANHRVNDAVFTEDLQQVLTGRFMYGPLDMVTLAGEKVLYSATHRPAAPSVALSLHFGLNVKMFWHRWTCTSWRSPLQASGCTTTQRWPTAAAACLLSSRMTGGWASECIPSKWWSGGKQQQQQQKPVLILCVKYFNLVTFKLGQSLAKNKK